jgi:8-oxo-dGTP pyrophosphatase MutT (NUDIX family)
MKREISAGIIVYRKTKEGPKFLILYHGHDYWNFAKGKIESEERSFAAAVRETREETGLTSRDLRIHNNFKVYERFTFKRSGQPVFKIVIFYLAETNVEAVKISSEHQGYGWFLFREARKILGRYRDSQRVLNQAYDFLRRRTQHPHTPAKPTAGSLLEQKAAGDNSRR